MKSLLVVTILLFIFACSKETVPGQKPQPFSTVELVGYKLSLVSKTGIAEFSFVDKDTIVANIGTVGGPVAGPLLEWKIDSQGRLVIDFYSFKQYWKKLSVRGDLIEVEYATGPIKPFRQNYIIQPTGTGPSSTKYSNNSFTEGELAGSDLLLDSGLKYSFKPDGTGTFSVNPQEDSDRTFRWRLNEKGMLQMKWASGRLMLWRKISRTRNNIVAEISEPPSKPGRDIYRRSRL
jgi:hypothetical protein